MTKSQAVALCFVLALSNLASACPGALGPSDATTGIKASVRRGPINPSGGQGTDNTSPVDSAVVVVSGITREGGFAAYTDSLGQATFTVNPGDYRVTVSDCPGAVRVPLPLTVTVTDGQFSPASMVCDTGIR